MWCPLLSQRDRARLTAHRDGLDIGEVGAARKVLLRTRGSRNHHIGSRKAGLPDLTITAAPARATQIEGASIDKSPEDFPRAHVEAQHQNTCHIGPRGDAELGGLVSQCVDDVLMTAVDAFWFACCP